MSPFTSRANSLAVLRFPRRLALINTTLSKDGGYMILLGRRTTPATLSTHAILGLSRRHVFVSRSLMAEGNSMKAILHKALIRQKLLRASRRMTLRDSPWERRNSSSDGFDEQATFIIHHYEIPFTLLLYNHRGPPRLLEGDALKRLNTSPCLDL